MKLLKKWCGHDLQRQIIEKLLLFETHSENECFKKDCMLCQLIENADVKKCVALLRVETTFS